MNNNKKKILFFSLFNINSILDQGIYPDLLGEFNDNDFDIYILSPSERGQKINNKVSRINNITIIQVPCLKIQKTNKIEKLISSLSLEFLLLKAYKKHLKNITFDLVLFPTPSIFVNNLLKGIKLSKNGFKYLLLKDIFPQNAIDLKFLKPNSFFTKYFEKVESKLYNNVDFIGCMSEANMSYIINERSINKDKIEVNPNSVNLSKYPKLYSNVFRKAENIKNDDLVFVYGGNLGKPQGINKIIKIAEYIENNSSIFFIICGKGTEAQTLKNYIKKKNLKKTKIFSNLTKKEYLQIVKESDLGMVFLHKSFSIPNYPSRVLDYMNYKLPVFSWTDNASDIGDIFVSNNAGFSFKSENDFDKIKLLIKKLNSQELKIMGKNSREILLNNFQVKHTYKLIENKFK